MSTRLQTQVEATPKSFFTPVRARFLQRKCACGSHTIAGGECAECRKKRLPLQRRITNQAKPATVPSIIHEVLRSPGLPLDLANCSFMESRFGHDFSQVRVHNDVKAAESAKAINAWAYTVGQDVVFGAGQYTPGTSQGRRLLAHELTHVVQQSGNSHLLATNVAMTVTGDAFEQEAEDVAEDVTSGKIVELTTHKPGTKLLQRADKTPVELSEAELRTEIDRLDAEIVLTDVTDPRWSELVERSRTLHGELTNRLLNVRYTRVPDLEIISPIHDDVFYIDAIPRMPNVQCRARIRGIQPNPTPSVPFNWQLDLVETVKRGSCPSAQIGECRQRWIGTRVTGGAWSPNFGNTIQGGDATLRVNATVHGQQLTAPVTSLHIRGTNPGAAAITARLGGAGTDADQIACRESRRRQFTAAGLPLLGPGGDTGVMQLCNPAATCHQRWDWTANVDQGLALFGQKRAAARRYLNAHQVGGHYPNDQGLNDAQVFQRESIKRYNRGHYWEWNADANRWEARPSPANGYVAHVLGCR